MEYIVKSGDSLSLIARANSTTIATLMRLNPNIEDANHIHSGQIVQLPKEAPRRETRAVGQVADCSECADDYVDLLHQADEQILMPLTAAQQREFEQEEAVLEQLIQQFYAGLNGAEETILDHKKTFIERFEQERIIDQSKPSEPMRLTEIRRVNGNRHYAYVRKDSGWKRHRSYKIDAQDKARAKGWFDPATGKVDPGKLRDTIAKDLQSPTFKVAIHEQFLDWCLLEWQSNPKEWTPVEGMAPIVVGAEAQAMRFAMGASLSSGYDPKTMSAHLAGKVSASASLVEGKANAVTVWPAEEDCEWFIRYRDENNQIQRQTLGKFRTQVKAELAGFAGASALLSADLHVDMSEGIPRLRGASGTPQAQRHKPGNPASAQASAFAGVRADGKLEGSIEWKDTLEETPVWKALCMLGVGGGVALGLGADAMVEIKWSPRTHKFFFNVRAGVVVGGGASGEVGAEVNAGTFASMIRCVYNSLLEVDFKKLEDIDDMAFSQLCHFAVYGILTGATVARAAALFGMQAADDINQTIDLLVTGHQTSIAKEQLAIKTAINILSDFESENSGWLKYAPPEVKGRLLNIMCFDYGPTFWDFYRAGRNTREEAILTLLKSSQSWRDYEEIVTRMNPKGEKGSFTLNRKRLQNLMRLFPYFELKVIEEKLMYTRAVANEPVQIGRYAKSTGKQYA
ncbi:hypothetical protein LCGC14_0763000 [marine sediment metagenome]|uniref:LysM peptidoglycan-binding domain-containing protein n=2 Tax=root TaxID=1 RepID=A0A831VXC8_9GAMM|nr:LysM peptidoglycan-binding domain-containing protein [Marinobacter antarcticus]HEA51721.1 LysM peptidoglycan-binding domain-containing protein [Marinobacter antarcticus]